MKDDMNDEDMRQWNNDAIAQITKGDNTPTNTLELRNNIRCVLGYCEVTEHKGCLYESSRNDSQEIDLIMELVAQAVNKAELACAVYMEPGRFQDYKNRRDGTFQNDPRLNRDETPNQVEGK